jgi:hypothetical protein
MMQDANQHSTSRSELITSSSAQRHLAWCVGSLEVAPRSREATAMPARYGIARGLNAVCGSWLCASAFLWMHSEAQFGNVVMVGFLVTVFALIALVIPLARYVNALLAVWLLSSILVVPWSHLATPYNSAALALIIFALAVFGGVRRRSGLDPTGAAAR